MVKRALHRIPALLVCGMIVAGSLGVFHALPMNDRAPWQVHHFDHADYRYLAEHFWGVEHDLSTYAQEFSGAWGAYLSRLPFRDIGVGTWYLVTTAALDAVAPGRTEVQDAWLLRAVLQAMIALSILTLAAAAKRHYGAATAIGVTAACALPVATWSLTDEMLSEPLLRCAFLLLMAATVHYAHAKNAHRLRWVAAIAATLTVLTLLKSQWLLLAWGMSLALLVECWWKRATHEGFVAGAIVSVAATGMLLLTHQIGWGTTSLFIGSGLHANLKSGGGYHQWFCEDFSYLPLCRAGPPADPYWHVRTDAGVGVYELALFDKRSSHYLLRQPEALWDAARTIVTATNFPRGADGAFSLIIRALDIATWAMLLWGLRRKTTFILSALGIGLWAVPAVAAMLAVFDARYLTPMGGGVLALALSLAAMQRRRSHARHPQETPIATLETA